MNSRLIVRAVHAMSRRALLWLVVVTAAAGAWMLLHGLVTYSDELVFLGVAVLYATGICLAVREERNK